MSRVATVLLVTASYDQTIRFWEASSGVCNKSIQYTDSVFELFLTQHTSQHHITYTAASEPHGHQSWQVASCSRWKSSSKSIRPEDSFRKSCIHFISLHFFTHLL